MSHIFKWLRGRHSIRSGNVKIKVSDPWYWRVLVVLFWLVVGFAAGVFYAAHRADVAGQARDAHYQSQFSSSQGQVAALERQLQVFRATEISTTSEMRLLQDELTRLREELVFYKSVTDRSSNKLGMKIYSARIEPTQDPKTYRYDLLVGRVGRNNKNVPGQLRLTLQGSQSGKPVTQPIEINDKKNTLVDARNYSRMSGVFNIPTGFVAQSVLFELFVPGAKSAQSSQVAYFKNG